MTDYRVKFDFVVHFTNGGSLSAHDFRLDIPDSDVTDESLAAHLIRARNHPNRVVAPDGESDTVARLVP